MPKAQKYLYVVNRDHSRGHFLDNKFQEEKEETISPKTESSAPFLSARKADLKKGFQHLVVVVLVLVCTRVKKAFRLLKGIQCEILNCL
jgi:hypothetical protein